MRSLFDMEGIDMKRCDSRFLSFFPVFGLLVVSAAGAEGLDALPPTEPPLMANVATPHSSRATLDAPRWKETRQKTKAKIVGLKADVVRDVRGTSAFVKDQANLSGAPSRWLVGLAACGLVVIQLRRKHKSLPQRRIVPYC
jgi:hypothetical protein